MGERESERERETEREREIEREREREREWYRQLKDMSVNKKRKTIFVFSVPLEHLFPNHWNFFGISKSLPLK